MKRGLLAVKNVLHKNNFRTWTVQSDSSSIFNFYTLLKILLATGLVIFGLQIFAQTTQQEADFKKVLTERSAKIVNTLGLNDSDKYKKVLDELVNQYINLNAIHDQSKAAIAEIKAKSLSGSEMQEAVKKQEEKKSGELLQLHEHFLTHLKKSLTDEQLEKVKDGMTYKVFPITYTAYLDMLPGLTTEQKEKIYNWLKEARELAMDEGSSDDKHKVFGKYKGRINNYLSAAGYDMKKEGEEWQKRIKEREVKTKEQKSS
jgi:hypothetical protein